MEVKITIDLTDKAAALVEFLKALTSDKTTLTGAPKAEETHPVETPFPAATETPAPAPVKATEPAPLPAPAPAAPVTEAPKPSPAPAPAAPVTEAPKPSPAPAPTYNINQVRAKVMELSRRGPEVKAKVKAALNKYAESVPGLSEADYPAFMADLEGIA